MSIWGKIFGGTGGFFIGGPLGGLLGVFAGHAIDKFTSKKLPESIAVRQVNYRQKWPKQMVLSRLKN